MANIKTRALEKEELSLIINTIRNGYVRDNGRIKKPNDRIATALCVEANLGIRISDICKLKMSDIVKERGRYHLNIIEQKTGKKRTFTVPNSVYEYIDNYRIRNNISNDGILFNVSPNMIQKSVRAVRTHLGFSDNVSTHSMRKTAATNFYELSGFDVVATQTFLQHGSYKTTLKYINISDKKIEDTINSMSNLV